MCAALQSIHLPTQRTYIPAHEVAMDRVGRSNTDNSIAQPAAPPQTTHSVRYHYSYECDSIEHHLCKSTVYVTGSLDDVRARWLSRSG